MANRTASWRLKIIQQIYWALDVVISQRRHLLNQDLQAASSLMRGVVCDIGGRKEKTLGRFNDPINRVERFYYFDIDPTSNPTVRAKAEHLPVRSLAVDTVVCCELLEHVPQPEQIVGEIGRILKKGGLCLASVPFLVNFHAFPNDYGRYTDQKLRLFFSDFSELQISKQGYFFSVLHQMLLALLIQMCSSLGKFQIIGILLLSPIFIALRSLKWIDRQPLIKSHPVFSTYTTGFFIKAVK